MARLYTNNVDVLFLFNYESVIVLFHHIQDFFKFFFFFMLTQEEFCNETCVELKNLLSLKREYLALEPVFFFLVMGRLGQVLIDIQLSGPT